jgi:hypothetical protein
MPKFTIADLSVVVHVCKPGDDGDDTKAPPSCTTGACGSNSTHAVVCDDHSKRQTDVMRSALASDLAALKAQLREARARTVEMTEGLDRAIAACDKGEPKGSPGK